MYLVQSVRSFLGPIVFAALSAGICNVHAQDAANAANPVKCLTQAEGYLRARLSGALNEELVWGNDGTECTGSVRLDEGVRLRFRRASGDGQALVIVFGVAKLREGEGAALAPVNVTLMREGKGEFYSTQGDDKCMLENVRQQPLIGIPHRTRSYRLTARGFCTEPARAVNGQGAVLLSRFDIAGRVDYEAADAEEQHALLAYTP